jgi:hypothetical protein
MIMALPSFRSGILRSRLLARAQLFSLEGTHQAFHILMPVLCPDEAAQSNTFPRLLVVFV